MKASRPTPKNQMLTYGTRCPEASRVRQKAAFTFRSANSRSPSAGSANSASGPWPAMLGR
jgi:hypothetical protein